MISVRCFRLTDYSMYRVPVRSILSQYQTLREGELNRIVHQLFFNAHIAFTAAFEGKRLVAFSIGQQTWSFEVGRRFSIKGPYHAEPTLGDALVEVLAERCIQQLRSLVDSKDDAGIPFIVEPVSVESISNVVPITA